MTEALLHSAVNQPAGKANSFTVDNKNKTMEESDSEYENISHMNSKIIVLNQEMMFEKMRR